MTTKEKLEKVLETLKKIADNRPESWESIYAAKVYAELTTPRTEPVQVKRWIIKDREDRFYLEKQFTSAEEAHKYCDDYFKFGTVIELTGHYTRPIPEPETWEGKVFCSHRDIGWLKGLPNEWIGKRVIVEVCE